MDWSEKAFIGLCLSPFVMACIMPNESMVSDVQKGDTVRVVDESIDMNIECTVEDIKGNSLTLKRVEKEDEQNG
jgi:hypothetical protein